ncbi:D-cysteine desulfhydrase [Rhodovibrionaceae bacterium A322]
MTLTSFPRLPLAQLPTALEPLPRLSAHLDGPEIFVKRDDCTGLAGGGNKTRKLEFLMADAQQQGADTVVTVGATQSNHVRQTVAAAAKLGLKAEVLLEKAVVRDEEYAKNGNYLLDHLMGAVVHDCEPGEDLDEKGRRFAEELTQQGRSAYFIPTGGSSVIGALGYVDCARETLKQSTERGLAFDGVVLASGSQGTQAGFLVGLLAEGSEVPLIGVSVSRGKAELESLVYKLALATADKLGLPQADFRQRVVCDDRFFAPGYGQPNEGMVEAVRLCAQLEGLLLDPVYSGKAMAGLIQMVREGRFRKGQKVLFIHTGGQAALHAYRSVFEDTEG